MSKKGIYLFTEEWYEGGPVHVAAYGKCEESEVDEICRQMDMYSPFDYACPNESDTEEEYRSRLQVRIDNGDDVMYYEKK